MEHQEAKTMHAAEKYVLGEMTGDLREQFEEHYFDCLECALDVRTAAAFIAASKEVFAEEPAVIAVPRSGDREEKKSYGWRRWLKPLVAIPAMAALVVMMIYEGRNLNRHATERPARVEPNLVATADFGLRGGDRVENETTVVRVRESDTIGLHFDFTPSQPFDSYFGEIRDVAGRVMMQVTIPAERINKEVKFVVPAGKLRAGNYVLWIYGEKAMKSAVAKYAFSVEIIP